MKVSLSLPQMDVRTRATIDEIGLNQVNTLWIRTYSAETGEATSKWYKFTPGTTGVEQLNEFELDTKSGSSYIVGVANVDNDAVSKDDPTDIHPIKYFLDKADTWTDFLKIAVCTPSTYDKVYAPDVPLPMAGCFTNLVIGGDHTIYPHRLDDWQNENFRPIFIPASNTGNITMDGGAIHLRRLVSQITFNLRPGAGIEIEPSSYKVVNAPVFSWLYERPTDASTGLTTNFGDDCTETNSSEFYKTPVQYNGNNFDPIDGENGCFTFNFWQGENKHTGTATDYADRDKEKKDIIGEESDKKDNQFQENTGIFTSLCGDTWTSNNMASYVLITCNVKHTDKIFIDKDENSKPVDSGTPVYRSGTATYMIHLGYMNKNPKDFNCYRNTKYTYNVEILGLDQIRVEAFHGSEYPGVEGVVADVDNETINLDCHYHCFNIELSDEELKPWNETTKSGFGYLITTYENGVAHTYQESNFLNRDTQTADEEKWMNWIELRPTTGKDVLAEYKPRGENSDTFTLFEASKKDLKDKKSASGWYTVFVNEYTYEADGADESKYVNGKPIWASYVNQDPRRFYIRVTRSVSADGMSTYASSKYAAVQQSIMTYYDSNDNFTQGTGTQQNGSAVGVERWNESFGLNLRRSYTGANDKDNGRYNLRRYTQQTLTDRNNNIYTNNTNSDANNGSWSYFVQATKLQQIPAGNTLLGARTEYVPKLYGYRGNFTATGNSSNGYDPQPNAATTKRGTQFNNFIQQDDYYYIEAINACMNRNRDNNGNGIIDNSEIRWYVPAMGKYLRLILGNRSLTEPLMNYDEIGQLSDGNGNYNGDNRYVGRYMFFSSDGRVLWGMEGLSSSNWGQYVQSVWQVRCIRNLGLNLNSQIESIDRTVPAYKFTPNGTGGTVELSYYNLRSKRDNYMSGNGSGGGEMPAHIISQNEYNSIYKKFEISQGRVAENTYRGQDFRYDIKYTTLPTNYRTTINNNPCSILNTATSTGWRIPNIKELAIIRNLGFLNDMKSGSASNATSYFAMSCTFSAFNTKGENTETLKNGSDNPILGSRYDALCQNLETPIYIRCVRDVR